jgi:hypothetical protein
MQRNTIIGDFDRLPDEILLAIFSLLDIKSLVTLTQVNKDMFHFLMNTRADILIPQAKWLLKSKDSN